MLQTIASEARLAPPGATATLENGGDSGVLLGPVLLHQHFPGRAAVLALTQPDDRVEGHVVRFVERDPATLRWYGQWPDTRLGRLLVAPGVAPRP
jgi:hypothetical protein